MIEISNIKSTIEEKLETSDDESNKLTDVEFNNFLKNEYEEELETSDDESDKLTDEEFDNFLKNEYNYLRQSGHHVPSVLSRDDWQKITSLPTFTKRTNFYNYLFKLESAKKSKQKQKEHVHNEMLRRREAQKSNNHIFYGCYNNTMFLKIKESSETRFYNWRLANAVLFGQKVVFDLDFDHLMNEKEKNSLAKQIRTCHGFNKTIKESAALYLCNVKSSSPTLEALIKCIPTLLSASCMITVSEKSYIDLFPHENIVYLTPDAPEYLDTIDDDAVYIIGGIVDLSGAHSVTLNKAKVEKLKTFKLPIDKYLKWGSGSKRLAVNQVFAILMERKFSGNWERALSHVPQRKICL